VVKPPSLDIALAAEAPEYENPYSLVSSVIPTVYTGNGTTQSIASLPWRAGIVWFKALSVFQGHILVDDVRGSTVNWQPSGNGPEFTDTTICTSIDSNGFSLGSSAFVNQAGTSHVAWAFPPIAAGQNDTSGTVATTTYRSNVYSIFTYTGTGADNATVGHGLGVSPEFVILKRRNATSGNSTFGTVTGANFRMFLNDSAAIGPGTTTYKGGDNNTITLGTASNVNTGLFIAYAFRSVPGISKIDTYTGDGNSAGVEVDCGFAINFLVVKRTDNTGQWILIDSARNRQNNQLNITSNAEATVTDFYELTQRGFIPKRGNQTAEHDMNVSGATYLYLAFGSFRPTTLVPATDITVTAEPPTVTVT
jgi:hypothetical protein